MDDTALQKRLSGSLLRLREREPFFGALALFATPLLTETCATAATDGKRIFWSREFLARLSGDEVDAVMLHEVLHAALLHVPRRGVREPLRWNIAADIVVNGMVVAARLKLPRGAVRAPEWETLAVEEVYELLGKTSTHWCLAEGWHDLLDPRNDSAALGAHWRAAQAQARALMQAQGRGSLPVGWERELSLLESAQLDWRSYLWRHLVRTPTDFVGIDRRLVSRGLYLETLEGESVRVAVCVDTSGSIGTTELAQFLGEVQGILRSYPHLTCDLYFADAALHGPYSLDSHTTQIPPPVGGGGTDFCPFFAALHEVEGEPYTVCVYLTDGHGTFPDDPPACAVLWVVSAGGLAATAFPFGEVARLLMAG